MKEYFHGVSEKYSDCICKDFSQQANKHKNGLTRLTQAHAINQLACPLADAALSFPKKSQTSSGELSSLL